MRRFTRYQQTRCITDVLNSRRATAIRWPFSLRDCPLRQFEAVGARVTASRMRNAWEREDAAVRAALVRVGVHALEVIVGHENQFARREGERRSAGAYERSYQCTGRAS